MECGEYLGRGVTNFPCSLEKGHEGPHVAQELPRTVKERERWDAQQRHQASGLGEFQGLAETTAERYTENPTPPPGPPREGPPRVVRAGSVGEALDRAGVPVHAAETAPEVTEALQVLREGPSASQAASETPKEAPGPTKAGRAHDQPMPVLNDRPAVQDALIVDVERRKQIGIERYGTLLQPFNGRSAIRDAYEESLDMAIYLRQILAEQDEVTERVRVIRDRLDPPKPYTDTPPVSDETRDQVLVLLDDLLELLGV